jgi:hypothetical protein
MRGQARLRSSISKHTSPVGLVIDEVRIILLK